MTRANGAVDGSFRDPSGFLFWKDGTLYRQINTGYREHYDLLTASGLAAELQAQGMLVGHEECSLDLAPGAGAYRVIRPVPVPFISYPYEWCFSQLKDAALLTLAIQEKAMARGMSLKDASAYNVQFFHGRPMLIDTLSFEKYPEGRPWVAYRQFCQHFLAPLALMACRDVRLNQLSRLHLDGVPLDLASALLPGRTRFRFSLLAHIHLHARSQKHFADKPVAGRHRPMSRFSLLALVNSLASAVGKLRWQPRATEWADYYGQTNYSGPALACKEKLLGDILRVLQPRLVWDIGANTGVFSRLASRAGIPTIALDSDPAAVEKNYRQCRRDHEKYLLPLLGDITSPSPGGGWENRERLSLLQRGPADTVLALALVHHLAIANNLPLARIAGFFSRFCTTLVIEFIPKSDSQVQRLLASREDVFPGYHVAGFEGEFLRFFTIERREAICGTERILYVMRSRGLADG
jgi:hypothetical protein